MGQPPPFLFYTTSPVTPSSTTFPVTPFLPPLQPSPSGERLPSEQALDAAHARAVKALIAANPAPGIGADYVWALPAVEVRLLPVTLPVATAQAAPGTYGKYVVTAEKDGLWIARPGHPLWPTPRHLTPLTSGGLFAVDGLDLLRIGLKPNLLELWWKDEAQPRLLTRD